MVKCKMLTSKDFDTVISTGITLVKFGASWCGPCRQMTPVLNELAEMYGGINVKICEVDIEQDHDLAVKYDTRAIPTFFIFKDGEIKHKIVGAVSKQALIDEINI